MNSIVAVAITPGEMDVIDWTRATFECSGKRIVSDRTLGHPSVQLDHDMNVASNTGLTREDDALLQFFLVENVTKVAQLLDLSGNQVATTSAATASKTVVWPGESNFKRGAQ